MESFQYHGDTQILVATNIVAAWRPRREVATTYVISVDVPTVPEDYVHRSGTHRLRAEAEGDAFLLVASPEEKPLVKIERQIG